MNEERSKGFPMGPCYGPCVILVGSVLIERYATPNHTALSQNQAQMRSRKPLSRPCLVLNWGQGVHGLG